ncbi:MAG: hypothetical protein WAK03_02985 [Methylocystis sp.]
MRQGPCSCLCNQEERLMSDLTYAGLGVFLFIVIAAYARGLARL